MSRIAEGGLFSPDLSRSVLPDDLWSRRLRAPAAQIVVALAVAFLIRSSRFGNPVIHLDEQFYLLVGDRMLHGALPFVDIWDRKPIGLFLIYAGIRLLGGVGIVQYQIVASLFAAATAFVIMRMALRFAKPAGAVLAGIVYLIWLCVLDGQGGQSPVFYNLPMALAALVALQGARPRSLGRLALLGVVVMLLCGVSIQIKYTALFEGVFFGLFLLWCGLRGGAGPVQLLGVGALWVACALAPTGLALLVYWQRGEAEVFWFTNFTSLLLRGNPPRHELLVRLWSITIRIAPLLLCAAIAAWPGSSASGQGRAETPALNFLRGWLLTAIFGIIVFGTYFQHYALPLLVPLSLACAPLLGRRLSDFGLRPTSKFAQVPVGVFVILLGGASAFYVLKKNLATRGDGRETAALVQAITPRLTNCLYLFDGEPILYHLTGSCLPSRFVFPGHLNSETESKAIGIDPKDELRRILADRPSVVVLKDRAPEDVNPESWDIIRDALARDYREVASLPLGNGRRLVYALAPASP